MTSIIIPENITKIGDSAFASSGLASIELPRNLTILGESCFSYSELESLIIPDGISIIERNLLNSCESLVSVVIPNVTSIGERAFSGCPVLGSISLKSYTSPIIGANVFGDDVAENSYRTYTGRNTYDQGTNILYVPAGATGYDTGAWLDPLQNEEKCGFTISYTL